jgi:hypothetical protein
MRRWDRLVDSYMEEYRARGISPQAIAYTEARLSRWLKGRRPRIGIEEIDAEKTAMKHWRRRENLLRRWAWGVRWCSELWVELWVEGFGATLYNLLKQMVGLGGLEPTTSPLSVLRSSVSYQVVVDL